ncbi:MAG: VWA domain-containing protein [Gammaproteobacteria bacterium]|nr:VWA domain-containing protein [Gammaproteobacteria bacterium]
MKKHYSTLVSAFVSTRARAALLGLMYGLLVASPVLGDDTEIFFGGSLGSPGTTVFPNVLFVLDTSSSMTSTDGLGVTRLDRMKEALTQILDSAANINVGLMRFSRAGGPVLFPVSYIDEDVCNVESCDNSGPSVATRIGAGGDDAEEDGNGVVNLASSDLELVEDPALANGVDSIFIVDVADDVEERSNGSMYLNSSDLELVYDGGNQKIGLRFTGVALPDGAVISSAFITFITDENPKGNISVDIYGHAHDNSAAFSSSNTVSNYFAAATNARVDWNNLPAASIGAPLVTPDLSTIVNEIIARPGWVSGNSLSFLIERDPSTTSNNSNKRTLESQNGSVAPVLTINYQIPSAGGVDLAAVTQTVGLRFDNIAIPQGATILTASLEFEVSETGSDATSLLIAGEAVDDAPAFSETTNDISGRSTTIASTSWDSVPTWDTVDATQQSPDITAVVQEIVSRSGWCGGNAMAFVITGSGKRTAKSYEASSGGAPLLKVTYDPDSIPSGGGCINQMITKMVASTSDDVEENTSDGSMYTTSSDLELVTDGVDQVIGMRFTNMPIPQGATILDASIEFEIDENGSGDLTLKISGQAHDDAPTFPLNTNEVSSRAKTASFVSWSGIPNPAINSKLTTPDLTAIVQEIVNRTGWASGNDMAFIIEKTAGTGKRVVESYDGESSVAPRLSVQIAYNAGATSSSAPTLMTVRERLKQEVGALQYKSGTPIVDTLYEAALYYRGEGVLFGKQRGNNAATTSRSEYTRVSHPSSYTGGGVVRSSSCLDSNLNSADCKSEIIEGSPIYKSPITESCQGNYIVLLSDGQPSTNESTSLVQAMTGVGSCVDSGAGACGPELSQFLYENDQISESILTGNQTITTYTIGFNFTGAWLTNVANKGNGTFFEATTSADLANVFDSIIKEIMKVDTSFVSPGATVNQFNRLTHRNEIYFSLFKPDERPKWIGNMKRYQLYGSPAVISDQLNVAAIDNSTGFFKDTSRSFWSSGVDGNSVGIGGAAEQVDMTGRKIFTYTGSSADLSDSSNALHESNAAITKAMLGIDTQTDAYRTELLQWTRGVDLLDYDENTVTNETRKEIGDPLHSRPVIVTYGGTSASPDITVFFGTNEGLLHAIDADDGSETFSFIPQELLPLLDVTFVNSSAENHPYGLDGAITAWVNDANGDNQINASDGDFVYLYIGMRRGGRNYYALDVTDRTAPSLLWTIKGGTTTGFTELGQSWSKPILTKVDIDGTVKQVLVFAGGYDADQDNYVTRTVDTEGRAIFMVDASTGALLWSGGAASTYDQTFSDMVYSIPADMRLIDINLDGLTDQMYVGDMGGQVWRFDINNGDSAATLVNGGVIADLSGTTAANNRRFYNQADVAFLAAGGDRFLSVSIGSGYRAHPLDTVIDDRFYMIKQTDIFSAPSSSSYTKLTESDLYDATDNLIGEGTTSEKATAITTLLSKEGWYIKFARGGEKVLAESVTINNQVIFTTFEPGASVSTCTTAQGVGRVYVVSVFDATPTLDMDNDGDKQKDDRETTLKRGGIPPEAVALFPENSPPVVVVGTETPVDDIDFDDLSIRTYWLEVTD